MTSKKSANSNRPAHYDKSTKRILKAKEYLNKEKMAAKGEIPLFTNDSVKRIVEQNKEREKLKNDDPNKDNNDEVVYEKFENDPASSETKEAETNDSAAQSVEEDDSIDGNTLLFYIEVFGMIAIPWLCERKNKETPEAEEMVFTTLQRDALMPSAQKVAARMKGIPHELILCGSIFGIWAQIVKKQPIKAELQKVDIIS